MATKYELQEWLISALQSLGGSGSIDDVCRHVWDSHATDLRRSGFLFYTWKYDIRVAAARLRDSGIIRLREASPRGIWELSK